MNEQKRTCSLSSWFVWIKIFYVVLVTVLCFQWKVVDLRSGLSDLDLSWVYALNLFFQQGLRWGRDVLITYGPLGMLLFPYPLGNNVFISGIFWALLALLACFVFSYILFSRKMARFNERELHVMMSLMMLYVMHMLGGMQPEYNLTYVILCILLICQHTQSIKWFIAAALLTVFSMFLKFNTGIANLATIIIFISVSFFKRNTRRWAYLLTLCCALVLFCSGYLIYNPSLNDLFSYLRGAYEISSGYNTAMSIETSMREKILFMFFLLLVVSLFSWIAYLNKANFWMCVLFLSPFFFTYKHAIVREDHILGVVPIVFVYISLYFLFMASSLSIQAKTSSKIKKLICAFFILFLVIISSLHLDRYNLISDTPFMALYRNITRVLSLTDDDYNKRPIRLDKRITSIISENAATIYPWEVLLAMDVKNYRPMPVFQAYTAYTPWLDAQNAAFFAGEQAPRFIVFGLRTIDGRFALMECPKTWFEIFRNYRILAFNGRQFLLERIPRRKVLHGKVQMFQGYREKKFLAPREYGHQLMRVEAKLSLWGHLAKIFYKIPEVNMEITLAGGRRIKKRVLLENLTQGALFDKLTLSLELLPNIMRKDGLIEKGIEAIQFSGEGLKYYQSEITVSFQEIFLEGRNM